MLKTSEHPENQCGKHWEEGVGEKRGTLSFASLFSRCHQVKEVSQPFEQAFYKHCRSSSPFLFMKPPASCGNNGGKRRTASGEKKSRGIWLFHPIFQQQESNSTESNSLEFTIFDAVFHNWWMKSGKLRKHEVTNSEKLSSIRGFFHNGFRNFPRWIESWNERRYTF